MDSTHMYREQIIDLYKHPLHFGKIEHATHSSRVYNPVCGDEIFLSLNVEKEVVVDAMFEGESCALCRASASLVTEKMKNMSLSDVRRMNAEEVVALLGISISPGRLKCVLLIMDAIREALDDA